MNNDELMPLLLIVTTMLVVVLAILGVIPPDQIRALLGGK